MEQITKPLYRLQTPMERALYAKDRINYYKEIAEYHRAIWRKTTSVAKAKRAMEFVTKMIRKQTFWERVASFWSNKLKDSYRLIRINGNSAYGV